MPAAPRHLGAQLLMVLVILTGLYFGYSFAREVVQAQRLANQAELGRQANERIAAENRKLARDLQYYQSDAYVELRARTDLNMRRPDEQIVLPVLPADPNGAAPSGAAPPDSVTAPRGIVPPPNVAAESAARNWDRWFSLFRRPGP
ncbi:MAG TPA: septum formation initiator family protein [Chloroflexia bacterium]|nr:septum formation initiator family protein [Chloroflexia bacterium]